MDGGPTRNGYLMQFQSDISHAAIKIPDAEELSKVASRNPMEQLVGRSSRRRIAFQGVVLYSLALLLIL